MSFHEALQTALVASLRAPPDDLGAPAYTSPPANFIPPIIVIGRIVAEEGIVPGDSAAFYQAAVEVWEQGNSPIVASRIADKVTVRLHGQPLPTPAAFPGVHFSEPQFLAEEDSHFPDTPFGPIRARPMTFRLFAQSED